MSSAERPILLFMCVANSARSQMAEGLAREFAPAALEVASAGSAPTQLNPYAKRALDELGIDIGGALCKRVDALDSARVRTVITLCAEEVCPTFAGDVERLHWPLPDPAAAKGTDAEILASFRDVRDELQRRLKIYFTSA